ncbi:ankyrin [Auricularia subglabra TFB-10046 SS5]|nr:ankyrin [Auricularia subglabra TFB-10046 SS5]
MQQPTPEAQAFVDRVSAAESGGVDALRRALKPALEHEAELRKRFATTRTNLPEDPHAGLVDVFAQNSDALRRTVARTFADDKDREAHHVMSLTDPARRKTGEPAMAQSLEDFRTVWSVFSESTLSQLGTGPWSNVIVAGGSVLACLLPLPAKVKQQQSKRALRKWFHEDVTWATSDVDLFLYGLNSPEEAEKKCIQIYEAIRDAVPWDVTCVRTKHAITIHSQFPYRSVQIVLRLYASPAEVLAGFDVDCACVAYDGARVWASPRAITAMMTQCNSIDITRRSPSYEVRLAKYHSRGFEIAVPDLRRDDIDPTIYERSLARISGLARLLVLEKITSSNERMSYLAARRSLRGIPAKSSVYVRRTRRFKGDLKADVTGLEISSYESAMFHVPYGPKYDAARVEKIIYQNDLGLNSTFNPKNKKRPNLHRHPAFFGTMHECLEDGCEFCPEPQDEEAKALQKTEDDIYIRGRVKFIQDDPGRQTVGSFKPIDEGDWAEQAYIRPLDKLFRAVARRDLAAVKKCLEDKPDLIARDHVGRTALHVAVLAEAPIDICAALIEAGARITSRLADGRTPLMLAAQQGNTDVAKLLLERSELNKAEEDAKQKAAEEAKKAAEEAKKAKAESEKSEDGKSEDEEMSEDSWSSVGESDTDVKKDEPKADANLPEELLEKEEELPDVIDLGASDWDTGFNALLHSIAAGSVPVLELLLKAGADPKVAVKIESNREALYPLAATLTTKDSAVACEIARRLIEAGASVSAGDDDYVPIFHRAVASGNVDLVYTFLRFDSKAARLMLNLPIGYHPLVTAVAAGNLAMTVLLLAHGAKTVIAQEDYDQAVAARGSRGWYNSSEQWRSVVTLPVEASLGSRNEFYRLLTALGADISAGTRQSYNNGRWNSRCRGTYLDTLRDGIRELSKDIRVARSTPAPASTGPASGSWKEEYERLQECLRIVRSKERSSSDSAAKLEERQKKESQVLAYLKDAEKFLAENGAKTWEDTTTEQDQKREEPKDEESTKPAAYSTFSRQNIGDYMIKDYHDLFEACWKGDDARIVELCLPSHQRAGQRPLEIGVYIVDPNDTWQRGVNPFTVACLAKRWQTAKVVLTIAAAQWDKPEDEPSNVARNNALDLDSDDDGSDTDSESDSYQAERAPINLEDIASRVSQVRSSTSPVNLIDATFDWCKDAEATSTRRTDILGKAIDEQDLEAFITIVNGLEEHGRDRDHVFTGLRLSQILYADAVHLLDEYIRRTGRGIDLEGLDVDDEAAEPDVDAQKASKIYLGLNVHGKKRKDLARRSDPDAPGYESSDNIPLLWQAARAGAVDIIAWLQSPAATAAYRFYSFARTTDRALLLRRINLDSKMPDLLGFSKSALNETPLFAAVLGCQQEKVNPKLTRVLKQLLKVFPDFGAHLHLAAKHTQLTPLLLLCALGGPPDVLEFLVSQGVDVLAVDHRGYNVLHLVCLNGNEDLFKVILDRVPGSALQALASRVSFRRRNTPFMIAVKHGRASFASALLNASKDLSILNVADVDGDLPVHAAARRGYSQVVALLLAQHVQLNKENG